MTRPNIAVAIACFNRKETTLRCLRALARQVGNFDLVVYVADDGSTDGTQPAINAEFPDVVVVAGYGDWYWTGATIAALDQAALKKPDYFLWLNDDVTLDDDAIQLLLEAAAQLGSPCIATGAVSDPDTNTVIYGGKLTGRHRLDLQTVQPCGSVQLVETMNGNVVLVAREVQEKIGPPDHRLRHNMADLDFGFRATDHGFRILLAGRVIGTCPTNQSKESWKDPQLPIRRRWRDVTSTKGFPPKGWFLFTWRHGGWRWPILFAAPYVRTLFARQFARASGLR